jgi:hypothetical protein
LRRINEAGFALIVFGGLFGVAVLGLQYYSGTYETWPYMVSLGIMAAGLVIQAFAYGYDWASRR